MTYCDKNRMKYRRMYVIWSQKRYTRSILVVFYNDIRNRTTLYVFKTIERKRINSFLFKVIFTNSTIFIKQTSQKFILNEKWMFFVIISFNAVCFRCQAWLLSYANFERHLQNGIQIETFRDNRWHLNDGTKNDEQNTITTPMSKEIQ